MAGPAGSPGARFRSLLAEPGLLLPGVHDALGARLAERAGFRAAYVSGSAVAMSLLGVPDIGLLTGTEMLDQSRRIAAAVGIPLLCDADTGYGNAVNVRHTVRQFEALGAAGVQLEDQAFPKRCGHFDGTALITAAEMEGKVRAAVAARRDTDFVIVARTDALVIEGVDAALDRARRYAAAGADVLFVEAPGSIDDLRAIGGAGLALPLLVNVVEGGRTPQLTLAEYQAMGFRVVLHPTAAVRVAARALDQFYRHLATTGTSQGFAGGMVGFDERNDINDLDGWTAWDAAYVVDAEPG